LFIAILFDINFEASPSSLSTFIFRMIFFAESASFSALPESDDFHDLAKRFELNARLWMDVFAEQTFPRIIGQVFVNRLGCRLRRFVVKFNVAQYAEMFCSKEQTTITKIQL
jgi:hypothetical protein